MPRSVIYLNNINIYINLKIRKIIEKKGYLIRYFLPYLSEPSITGVLGPDYERKGLG